jgi:hypothetical protein
MMLVMHCKRCSKMRRRISALQNIWCFGFAAAFARLCSCVTSEGACDVDLALRLDVLVVCAVFAFVGAILLGAF